MNRILVLLFIACVGMSRARAQFISPVRIDSFLLDLYSKDVFNGGLAVVDQGKTVYIGTFGIADTEPTLLAKETPIPAGELAQQFTAWAVTRLISEGDLRFDDKITTLIPNLSDSIYGAITVRDLIHHTSGLPNYGTLLSEYSSYFRNGIDNQEIIKVLEIKKPELNFSPGSLYESNPVNYAVLTVIVEQLTKKSLRTFLQSALFDSLGISIPNDSVPRVAGLVRSGGELYVRDSVSYLRTYGKVQPLLSLDDWIAWLKYLSTPERWESAHYELFYSNPPHYFSSIPDRELFGMGLKWSEDTTVIFYSEFWNGISKYVQHSITDEVSFILFDNADINKNDFQVIVATLNDILKREIETARYRFNRPIDSNAPIVHASTINSSLSASEVYSKIIQIDEWPTWQSNVNHVSKTTTDQELVEWKMKVSGKKIKGETHTLTPPYTVGWTERRFGIRRVINCRIYPIKDGCEIEINSSTSGIFAKWFTNKNKLRTQKRITELLQSF